MTERAPNRTLVNVIVEWENQKRDLEKRRDEEINELNSRIKRMQYQQNLVAGGIAGLTADVVLQPFDFIRVRHQISERESVGIIRTFVKTYRKGGFRLFFKGFGAVALLSPISNSLYFAGYDFAKASMSRYGVCREDQMPVVNHAISGLCAIMFSGLVMVPGDVVVQRAQATNDKRYGAYGVFCKTLQEEGLRGFYRNYWTSIAVWGPYCSIYFASYEMMKSTFGIKSHEEHIGIKYFICSAVAGFVGSVITNPLDVIRVRHMVEGGGGLAKGYYNYASIPQAFAQIIRKEGIWSLMKGVKARIIWFVLNDALGMTIYEKLKHILRSGF